MTTPKDTPKETTIEELRTAQNILNGIGPSLEEVIVPVWAVVQSATYRVRESNELVPQHVMDIRFGPGSPSQTVRYNSSELDVLIEGLGACVKKITFPAIIGLQKGDNFKAYLVAADVRIHTGFEREQDKKFLVPRKLKEEEIAIKIEKYLGRDIVATYLSE